MLVSARASERASERKWVCVFERDFLLGMRFSDPERTRSQCAQRRARLGRPSRKFIKHCTHVALSLSLSLSCLSFSAWKKADQSACWYRRKPVRPKCLFAAAAGTAAHALLASNCTKAFAQLTPKALTPKPKSICEANL